jgi:hypothetical protein
MELSYHGPCSYRDGLGRLCRCDLYVYREGDAAVVVASEHEDNPGASITNTYEDLATGVWQKLGLPIDQVTWVEHYGAQAYGVRIDETFDWVTLERQGDRLVAPQWRKPGHDVLYTSGSVSRLDSKALPRSANLDFSWLSA